jgi:predicted esterase
VELFRSQSRHEKLNNIEMFFLFIQNKSQLDFRKMKTSALPIMKQLKSGLLCVFAGLAQAVSKENPVPAADEAALLAQVAPSMKAEKRLIGGNDKQLVFVLRHASQTGPAKGLGLILPGGSGSADFLPFCANVLAQNGYPEDWLVAQMVAPQWRPPSDSVSIWPSKIIPDPKAKFTTEDFIGAVLKEFLGRDVARNAPVVALGWSSSGHAVYSALMKFPEIRGAMMNGARCQESWFRPRTAIKGKAVFFYHSPEDAVCPILDAEKAVEFLPKAGAYAKLVKYPGGHGWPPGADHTGVLRDGLAWILETTAKK